MSTALVPSRITDGQLASLKDSGVPAIILPNASFDGASRSRRMSTFGGGNSGPNHSITNSLSTLRNRSRQFIRNNPLAQNAIDTYVSNMVGTGIVPRWKGIDPALKERLQKRWLRWTDEADAAGVCDFYGFQALAARTMIESGASLVRRRLRRPEDGLSVPLQLQLMEPDHLPHTMNQKAPNGNEIQMGVEFDSIGRRAAYWLYRRHPGDHFFGDYESGNTRRVPADECIHCFRPLRPGQIREIPWISNVMVRLYELDQYTDAELVRKKTAAMFAGFVKSPAGQGGRPAEDLITGEQFSSGVSRDTLGLEPGTIQWLDAGEEIEFAAPADIGSNTEAWMKQQLREIAVGIGVTYEQLTGDLSNVNYSSLRAGLVEFRRRCEMLIFHLLVFQFCRPVMGWWMDALVRSGAERIPGYWQNRQQYLDVEWFGQGWEYVNPVEDRLAEQMDMRNGTDSRQSIVAKRRGRDAEEIDKEIAEDNERADKEGLVFDSDPRQTAKNGAVQQAEAAAIAGSMNPQGGDGE